MALSPITFTMNDSPTTTKQSSAVTLILHYLVSRIDNLDSEFLRSDENGRDVTSTEGEDLLHVVSLK